MYAIIATGGKQYRVSEGDNIYVEKLNNEAGDIVTFPVMMISGETIAVGNPYISARRTTAARPVTVSPTPRWRSPASTAKR